MPSAWPIGMRMSWNRWGPKPIIYEHMSEKSSKRSILVVGSANMDMVVSTLRFPKPGETVLARSFGMHPGGKGANQAVAGAKLGGSVTFLGKMGRDMFRDRLFESLVQEGVDVSHVLVDDEASTGIALITVDDSGQNEIVVVSGSNMNLGVDDVLANEDLFDRAGFVLLQLEIPLETVVRAAQLGNARGASVILNPAPAAALPEELLSVVDILTPNESELELLTGRSVIDRDTAVDAARSLIDRHVQHVILTLGNRGALHVTASEVYAYPAYRVESVDTTAAGDAFNGALAVALSRGDELSSAVTFANAVAACCVTGRGAQTSLPTFEAVERFLRRQPVLEEDA